MPFAYFGRKARIAHLYPYARFPVIVEPFAGSASYALHSDHWTRSVVLIEKDPEIAALWRWLIDPETTAETIEALPLMEKGDSLEALVPDPIPRKLLQLSSASADHQKKIASDWMVEGWPSQRHRIAANVHKVKDWTLIEADYREAPDIEATWYIDPPYQKIIHGYKDSRDSIDFSELADFCQSRLGQVIVCEESGADWLPFEPLSRRSTIDQKDTIEVIWTNEKGTLF